MPAQLNHDVALRALCPIFIYFPHWLHGQSPLILLIDNIGATTDVKMTPMAAILPRDPSIELISEGETNN
jgi:hypothetical protein